MGEEVGALGSEFGGSRFGDERLAMLAALVDGDVTLAYRFATQLLAQGVPFDDIAVDVFGPVQAELGLRWAAGDLGVADEHAASAAVYELIVRLGVVAEEPSGPRVVVACPERDAHALGARVVASALALEGCRVLFLGASVPADDLEDYLELHRPLALALSCSITSALVGAASSVAVAHRVGVPVVGGGRAFTTEQRALRVGMDAFARVPRDAVDCVRGWEGSPPELLAVEPTPVPEHRGLADRSQRLIATALDAAANHGPRRDGLSEELARVLQVVEGALLLDEPGVIGEHIQWLRDTGPAHGLPQASLDDALNALAVAMDGDLQRAGHLLGAALH